MRRMIVSGLGIALGLQGLAAPAAEVIASSTSSPPAATLGTPRAGSIIARGKAQEPASTPIPAAPLNVPPPSTPLHAPMPSGTTAPPAPVTGSALPPGAVKVGPPVPAATYGPALPVASEGTFFAAPGSWWNWGAPLDQQRWYLSAEYLYWWTRDSNLPPLVTGGNPNDFIPGSLSPITGPNSFITYGNQPIDAQGRSGARFAIGRWFGDCSPWALEFGGFFLGSRETSFSDASSDGRLIARPFFESNRNRPSAEIVAAPGVIGSINVSTGSNFYGAHFDWRRKLWCPTMCGTKCGPQSFRLDGTVGFRYINFDEHININETSQTTTALLGDVVINGVQTIIPAGTTSTIGESFRVDNDFYGGSFGVNGIYNLGRWSLGMGAKLSLGNTRQRLEIEGGQVITRPDRGTENFAGGLLARPSNIGVYTADKFTVIPEVNFNVGYQFTNHFKMFVGYDFLYWNRVLRAADQIDTTVNITGVPFAPQPGTAQRDSDGNLVPNGDLGRPRVLMTETDFWAQGISVGALFTW